jgi:hypothetical protein
MRTSKRGEECERFLRITLAILQSVSPQILVTTGQHGSIMRKHHAEPETKHQLRVGEVLQHFVDRPFSRRFTLNYLGA